MLVYETSHFLDGINVVFLEEDEGGRTLPREREVGVPLAAV